MAEGGHGGLRLDAPSRAERLGGLVSALLLALLLLAVHPFLSGLALLVGVLGVQRWAQRRTSDAALLLLLVALPALFLGGNRSGPEEPDCRRILALRGDGTARRLASSCDGWSADLLPSLALVSCCLAAAAVLLLVLARGADEDPEHRVPDTGAPPRRLSTGGWLGTLGGWALLLVALCGLVLLLPGR